MTHIQVIDISRSYDRTDPRKHIKIKVEFFTGLLSASYLGFIVRGSFFCFLIYQISMKV